MPVKNGRAIFAASAAPGKSGEPPTFYRAEVVAALAPHLSHGQLVDAMAAIAQQNVPSLQRLLMARAEELWGVGPEYVALLRLAVQSADRDTCLSVVGYCAPELHALAGPEFAAEMIAAVRAVHRWWP